MPQIAKGPFMARTMIMHGVAVKRIVEIP